MGYDEQGKEAIAYLSIGPKYTIKIRRRFFFKDTIFFFFPDTIFKLNSRLIEILILKSPKDNNTFILVNAKFRLNTKTFREILIRNLIRLGI